MDILWFQSILRLLCIKQNCRKERDIAPLILLLSTLSATKTFISFRATCVATKLPYISRYVTPDLYRKYMTSSIGKFCKNILPEDKSMF